jgi:hypothetical protein
LIVTKICNLLGIETLTAQKKKKQKQNKTKKQTSACGFSSLHFSLPAT